MKTLVTAIASAVLLLGGNSVQAQDYPSEPIKIVVPFPAGGLVDTAARSLGAAAKAQDVQFQTVPTPGAAGANAARAVLSDEADGYALFLAPIGMMVTRPLVNETTFSWKDFEPVMTIAATVTTLSVARDGKYKTIEEFLQAARDNPGQISVATTGRGSIASIALSALEKSQGVKFRDVPFQGGPEAIAAVAGGHVDAVFNDNENPEIRQIASAHPRPVERFADVPTFAEAGVEDMEFVITFILFAKPGVSDEKLARLQDIVRQATATDGYRDAVSAVGMDPLVQDRSFLQDYIPAQSVRMSAIVDELGIGKSK